MQLWGGRFSGDADEDVAAFGRSIDVDAALALDDLDGSIAHVRGLGRAGIVSDLREGGELLDRHARDGGVALVRWSVDDPMGSSSNQPTPMPGGLSNRWLGWFRRDKLKHSGHRTEEIVSWDS